MTSTDNYFLNNEEWAQLIELVRSNNEYNDEDDFTFWQNVIDKLYQYQLAELS